MTERPAGRGLRETLSNPRADRIKQVASLAGRSARERHGLFLVEGPQAVRELVVHRPDLGRDVYVSEAVIAAHDEIVQQAVAEGLFVHPVSAEVSEALSGDSQGIVAVARTWDAGRVDALEEMLGGGSVVRPGAMAQPWAVTHPGATARQATTRQPPPDSVAVLVDVRDPGNAGNAIRTADAAGARGIMLAGDSVDVFNPKVVRASAGSLFHVPVLRGLGVAEVVQAARGAGWRIVAADVSGRVQLGDPGLDLAAPTAWLFGNEARGLSADELALADMAVRIPILGSAESLNLGNAVAVCLYAAVLSSRPSA